MSRPAFTATVLWRCPKCKGVMNQDGVHAPHWTERNGRKVLVDCVGDEVSNGQP